MKIQHTLTGLAAGVLMAGSAAANERHYERAPVVSVTPVYRIVEIPESREICYDREVRERRSRAAPTILGTIIGGAVGNQFGGGNGRRALTVAGAALGAAIGHDAAGRHQRTRIETQCELIREYREEERLDGYRVEYEYDGQIYSTRTQRDPGKFIDLEVSVSPVTR